MGQGYNIYTVQADKINDPLGFQSKLEGYIFISYTYTLYNCFPYIISHTLTYLS